MTTQIMFKIEDKLKKAAQIRARKEGFTLSEFYKSATKSFIEGKINIGITAEIGEDDWKFYTKESIASFKKGMKDFKEGRFFRVR